MLPNTADIPWYHWAISIGVIVYFVSSYFSKLISKGRYFDFYHLFIFLNYVFPLFVMSMFAYDVRNAQYVGNNFQGIVEKMPEAILVTSIGCLITIILSDKWADKLVPRRIAFVKANSRVMATILTPRPFIVAAILACFGIAAVEIISIGFLGGRVFNLRGEALADERIRPWFNLFVVTIGPLFLFASAVLWLRYRRKIFILIVICIAAGELISGSRGSLIGPILTLFYCLAERRRRKLKLSIILCSAAAFVIIGLALGSLRVQSEDSGGFSPDDDTSLTSDFFYGNNFSDVRDFAWILSRWDGKEPHGRTYLAGILGFVPRSIVPFRQEYAISLYLNQFLGFEEDKHAGLRPGPFGEAYINFGWPGVIAMGTILGIILGDVRYRLERLTSIGIEDVVILAAQLGSFQFMSAVMASASFWLYYAFLLAAVAVRVISFLFYPTDIRSTHKATKRPIPSLQRYSENAAATHSALI